MRKGIGCDIVDRSRMEQLLNQNGFSEKVYMPYEQEYISGKTAHTAAGIWAAKEDANKAVFKIVYEENTEQ